MLLPRADQRALSTSEQGERRRGQRDREYVGGGGCELDGDSGVGNGGSRSRLRERPNGVEAGNNAQGMDS